MSNTIPPNVDKEMLMKIIVQVQFTGQDVQHYFELEQCVGPGLLFLQGALKAPLHYREQ